VPFQPGLMFVGRAGALLSEACFKYSTLGSWPYLQTLGKARKACQDKQSSLLRKFVIYGKKV
jgi:hypothetical protein